MTSYNAALLDELMGKNRNAATGDEVRLPHWSDDDVCRYFLCGFCPHDLFTNTRADLGACDKSHDEKLRETYENSSRYQKCGYEDQFCRYLRTIVSDVERRIRRGQDRIKLNSAANGGSGNSPMREERRGRIEELSKKINSLIEEAERLGCEGNVEKSQNVMKECEVLQHERDRLNEIDQGSSQQNKELEVCDICGAFRIKDDAPSRQEEHLTGKMHLGYARIRDYIREWEEKQEEIRKKRETATSGGGGGSVGSGSQVGDRSDYYRDGPRSRNTSSDRHHHHHHHRSNNSHDHRRHHRSSRDSQRKRSRSNDNDRSDSKHHNGGHHSSSSDKKRDDRSHERRRSSRSRDKKSDSRRSGGNGSNRKRSRSRSSRSFERSRKSRH